MCVCVYVCVYREKICIKGNIHTHTHIGYMHIVRHDLMTKQQKLYIYIYTHIYSHIYICVCVYAYLCAKSLQLCLTLCDPTGCSPPDFSVHGILQARIPEWVAMPSSRGIFPPQGLNPPLLCLLIWQAGSSPPVPPGKPMCISLEIFLL